MVCSEVIGATNSTVALYLNVILLALRTPSPAADALASHVPSLLRGTFHSERAASMRSSWTKVVLWSAAATALLGAYAFAQSGSTDEGKRKVKSRVTPSYPELARRMNITGKVKIEVIIAADGRVKSTRAIGGHPLLVQACQDAVKEWKFVPASDESTQVVEFDFASANN